MPVNDKITMSQGPADRPQLYFDGECPLCCGAVRFLIRHDRRRQLRYGSLQGISGRKLLKNRGLGPGPGSSILLLDQDRLYTTSEALLRVCRYLDGAWPLLARVLRLIPRPLRDRVYRLVARYRYRWFGRLDRCWLPDPDLKALFLN